MIADYSGECAECALPIRPGQTIVLTEDRHWAHASCPAAPDVCPTCWLQFPCGCYA